MLVSDIVTRVQRVVGDADQLQVTEADIIRWINDAMRECAIDNQLLTKKATSVTVVNDSNYSLPSDVLKLHSVRYDGSKIKTATLQQVEQEYNLGAADKGRPEVCYVWDNLLELYPIPNEAKNLDIYYTRKPVDVTGVGNTPELPDQYHQRLVDYCLAQVAQMDDNQELYMLKMDEFRTGVQKLKDIPEWENDLYPFITVSPADQHYGESGVLY
jgi:hypothetical protein